MPEPTPYWITCRTHGDVNLSRANYEMQMNRPSAKWVCPQCGEEAQWNDDLHEAALAARPFTQSPTDAAE